MAGFWPLQLKSCRGVWQLWVLGTCGLLFFVVLKLLNLILLWGLSTLDPTNCRHTAPADRRAGLLLRGGWWQLG